jgi:hypothetical protein
MKRTLSTLALFGALSSPLYAQTADSTVRGVHAVAGKLQQTARASNVPVAGVQLVRAIDGNPTYFQIGPTRAVREALVQGRNPEYTRLDSLLQGYSLLVKTVYSAQPRVELFMVDANMDGTVDYASQRNKDGSITAIDPKNAVVRDAYVKSVTKK